ncbi:DUF4132 domain-containing protein [Nocardia sp. SYP-A9097]|uniref:DUF4132 domain-containing protein n=1 Tax=Nocardia sp. SYP-A9097 TaxID=2663237 RepID=UPI00129BDC54|nr:DUF4132 domain-containing protein [Nocardia sp. SYP-A9097]MRH89688.1 DUF4132 domain-containing protein [Nocardia sp. SYP-A9097]
MNNLQRTDENAWIVPDEWWEKAAPYRGHGPVTAVPPEANALTALRKWVSEEQVLRAVEATAADGNEDLAQAARAAIEVPETATPLGLAVTGALAAFVADERYVKPRLLLRLADAWITGYGAEVTAETATLFAGLVARKRKVNQEHQLVAEWTPNGGAPAEAAMAVLARLRAHLCTVPDAEYAQIVDRLTGCRESGSLPMRMATSYLIPAQPDWLASDLRSSTLNDFGYLWYLYPNAVHANTPPEPLPAQVYGAAFYGRVETIRALVHAGPAATGYLVNVFDNGHLSADDQRSVAAMLAQLPTDTAFDALVRRAAWPTVRGALLEAMLRFPCRAHRLLSATTPRTPSIDTFLRHLMRVYPYIATDSVAPAAQRPDTLAMQELPELLRAPAWERGITRTAPTVVKNLGTAHPAALAWLPGEQQEWANKPTHHRPPSIGWEEALAQHLAGEQYVGGYQLLDIFAFAPIELVTPHLDTLAPYAYSGRTDMLRRLLGRYGGDMADATVAAVQEYPYDTAEVLLPVTGTSVTTLMTRLYSTNRGRPIARSWFERHLAAALPDLIAAALGKPGKPRVLAWSVLRAFDNSGHRELLLSAAKDLGTAAATAIEAELSTDPLLQLPPVMPALPAWLTPSALAPIILRDNGGALPSQAVATVCLMLALGTPDGEYPGSTRLTELADPDSLAKFTWDLFETWELAGYPPAQGWILQALGIWGNDDTVRALAPYIRAWPADSAHARAVAALDVLTAIGSGSALRQLNKIAEKVKFKGLRVKALEKITQVAQEQGMSTEELADRLVPDFGLAADGTLHLDYGPRGFLIGVDEQLRPTISDAQGKTVKSLPKPGVKDDPVLAPEAYKTFAGFKKDLKAIAAEQVQRLERAMVRSRRWTAQEYRELFIEHPLSAQSARRLVWAAFDRDGNATASFRIAEDGTLADAEDDPITLTDDTMVGIAHPMHLIDSLPTWTGVFADYELLQPFPQLSRTVYRLTEQDRDATTLARFEGLVVPTTKILGMTRSGWELGETMDGARIHEIFRVLAGDHSAVVGLDPGISAGELLRQPEQQITVMITTGEESAWARHHTDNRFGELDAVTASELLREIAWLEEGTR